MFLPEAMTFFFFLTKDLLCFWIRGSQEDEVGGRRKLYQNINIIERLRERERMDTI